VSPAAVWSPGVGLQELRMTYRLSPRCLPIKLDSTSNGEFAPVPLDRAALHARTSASQVVDAARYQLGLSRRDYLVSLLGAAATLAAFDRAFAAAGRHGGRFVLPEAAHDGGYEVQGTATAIEKRRGVEMGRSCVLCRCAVAVPQAPRCG
jgi:hypothetical protein